jgi:hypothetical protein
MRLWRRVKYVLYHRIAATGGFFVAEILGVMWPAIQKPKALKGLQKEIPSRGDVGRRLALARFGLRPIRFPHATSLTTPR